MKHNFTHDIKFLEQTALLTNHNTKLFIPKADEKLPLLKETSGLPGGTWLLNNAPSHHPTQKLQKRYIAKPLEYTTSLGRQFQGQGNPHSIGTHEYRCKIKLKPCFGTIYLASACFCGRMLQDSSPALVRVVSLYLDSRTQQAAPLFLLVQQKGKEYVGENEKVRADLTFTCSQNSDKLGSPLKALTNTAGKMRTHQLFHKMQREAKARAVFISPHLYPPAGH